MGTGGTLPSSIVQQVSLFNTTGLIEKDKGIYFCPFLSKTAKTISTLWLIAFNTVVSSTTTNDYKDITISNWSPRDRSLVIKGVPDDFRCITTTSGFGDQFPDAFIIPCSFLNAKLTGNAIDCHCFTFSPI